MAERRAMAMGSAAASPDDYVAALSGWQRNLVQTLRLLVREAAAVDERVKWTHLVYSSNGPVLLIRAEAERVLFGFWRGKRLREIEPKLKASGKYELANHVLREGDSIDPNRIAELVRHAVRLNAELGDPTRLSR